MAHLATSYNAMVRRIRAANEATKLAHEKLRHSEKLATLGVLSSSVAHRINNPLGGLFNCVQLLRRKGDDPGFRKSYLDLVEEGLSSIEKTVSQLLRSASRHAGEEKRAEVALVVKNVLKFLDYRLSKQAISYEEHLEPDVKLAMPPRDLEEILMCTTLNAIQAMATGGTLTITGRRHRGQVEISIADSGIGIASEQLPRVFELFYSTKPAGEGTGLGMWMVYELVKKHQGEIAIVSEPGRGTTVRFTIAEER
jgi:signal transduction histidine kinase